MSETEIYSQLPDRAFWQKCRDDEGFLTHELYLPKFPITSEMGIVTAGSCFAQRFTNFFKTSNAKFLDVEPCSHFMSQENRVQNGYGIYSARYGNIYTTRHLRQLLEEAFELKDYDPIIWPKDGGYIDAMRPTIEAQPFSSEDEVIHFRQQHLRRLRELFSKTDLLFFTLSLTESWRDKASGRVFPTFPGVFRNVYDETKHKFYNAPYEEAKADLESAIAILKAQNPNIKILLSLSPVGLIASNSGQHVLAATADSKAKLRTLAGALSATSPDVDYFPAFEFMNAHVHAKTLFDENRRNVSNEGIKLAMALFFFAHEELINEKLMNKLLADANDAAEDNQSIPIDNGETEENAEETVEENNADLIMCQEELLGLLK